MTHTARVAALRDRIHAMQSTEPVVPLLPTRPDLARLLPGGGLKAGAVYRVQGATSLLFAALSAASADGQWCALVGWPHLGAEAMADAGLSLERCALVPQPGARWMSVVSGLADAMPLVAVRPPVGAQLADADAARLAARLRERGSTLLVAGQWPGAEASLQLQRFSYDGLERGHGLLLRQSAEVVVRDRAGRLRSGMVQLGVLSGTSEVRVESGANLATELAPIISLEPRLVAMSA
ncbi:MAG: hypothetical protein ACOYBP_06720 [Microbacteriaceae bacterium]